MGKFRLFFPGTEVVRCPDMKFVNTQEKKDQVRGAVVGGRNSSFYLGVS